MLATATLAAGLMLTVAACTDTAEEPAADNPALAAPLPEGMIRGTVLETMDAAGYTYLLLDTAEGQRWVATQQTPVAVGDTVQTIQGMAMEQFTSESLNRTFEVDKIFDIAGGQQSEFGLCHCGPHGPSCLTFSQLMVTSGSLRYIGRISSGSG